MYVIRLETLLLMKWARLPSSSGLKCFNELIMMVKQFLLIASKLYHCRWSLLSKFNLAHISVSGLSESSKNTVGHVKYESLIADPVGTVRDLYKSFGWNFTAEYEAAIRSYIAKNKEEREANKSRASKHNYSLEQYGLSEADIASKTGWYCEKYI
jgi:hypothetical protein